MPTFKQIIASTLLAASLGAAGALTSTPATAGSQVCGYWAFGGAFQVRRNAIRRARRVRAHVFDLDRSDSPNAGKGYWVVTQGPDSRSWARRKARKWRRMGVPGAYAARRCFTGL